MEQGKGKTLQAKSWQGSGLEAVGQSRVAVVQGEGGSSSSEVLFENLVWMTSAEAARYLRKSVGALRVMVHRGYVRARKFHRRLYFRKIELDRLLDSSEIKGGIYGY